MLLRKFKKIIKAKKARRAKMRAQHHLGISPKAKKTENIKKEEKRNEVWKIIENCYYGDAVDTCLIHIAYSEEEAMSFLAYQPQGWYDGCFYDYIVECVAD